MHEITFASHDRPKGLTQVCFETSFLKTIIVISFLNHIAWKLANIVFQLSALLGQLNLDIKEVHALSTNDGYFLDIFIVVGWDHKVFLCKSLNLANI